MTLAGLLQDTSTLGGLSRHWLRSLRDNLGVLAYVFRFARMCRRQNVNVKAELTAIELSDVQKRLIVLTQCNEFSVKRSPI